MGIVMDPKDFVDDQVTMDLGFEASYVQICEHERIFI